jgi:dTMP kinase
MIMSASPGHPRFITFEGVDGAGKSTQIEWFARTLERRSEMPVVLTREPGGTPLGEALRTLVLHQPMHLETEALLMFAARREHLDRVIEPALADGSWVVCDRFIDTLREWVHPGLEPGTTLLFDVDAATAEARLSATRDKDRFELEERGFFERVRADYLRMARETSGRYRVIDGRLPVTSVQAELEEVISTLCSL